MANAVIEGRQGETFEVASEEQVAEEVAPTSIEEVVAEAEKTVEE